MEIRCRESGMELASSRKHENNSLEVRCRESGKESASSRKHENSFFGSGGSRTRVPIRET